MLPVSADETSDDVVIAAATRVQNRVPEGSNWDGSDDPALATQNDVKEMVGEQRQVPHT